METDKKNEGAVQWTKEQQQVIDVRNCNVLVSAAAGSGKTAVLVERIVKRITQDKTPIDIDKLLVVTFTNAAATEMRERIADAIEKKLLEEPDNLHLQKQTTLIHSSLITTIHSFCLHVIRNYFHTIDLDPSFRIADETELKLLKADVLEKVLEYWYQEGEERFHQFVECYATGKTDIAIEEMVLQLYQFSMSYPWPKEWLLQQKEGFQIENKEDMDTTFWMEQLCIYIKRMLEGAREKNLEAIEICNQIDGPKAYMEALLSDQELIDGLIVAKQYSEWENSFKHIKWARLSSKKQPEVLEEKKELVKNIRKDVKKIVDDLKKQYFFQSTDEMIEDLKKVRVPMEVLIEITIGFMDAFQLVKEEKKIVDFNDLEHYALQILIERQEDAFDIKPSIAAQELSNRFEEILIDEYQDSNLVQETILNSISRERYGMPNVFMVGDVKQSIYKFRLARPELFMEKYDAYGIGEGTYRRIDLHKNFRSRQVVLDGINFIFHKIMQKELGNITYDEDAALYPGAVFREPIQEKISDTIELILITDEEKGMDEDKSIEEEIYSQRELEAKGIADRIKELVDPLHGMSVIEKETKQYRPCQCKDIVILLRTMSGWADVFVETLIANGVAAYSDTQSGYFSALEVKTILNYLKVLDNPRQDIPLASVMRSPIGGFTSEEMALIRIENRESELYEALLFYETENTSLKNKIKGFLGQLLEIRQMISYTPLHNLVEIVYEKTGYYDYVTVMPGGERRKGNLDMLVQKAVEFGNTSYSGLFDFNRYMEKLHKYEVDFGEASTGEGAENAVRIMSIHKSKGLEFPVVFVAGMGKPFNQQDSRSRLVIHGDYGIGVDAISPEERVKTPTLMKKAIQKQIALENMGEELRVLYVALTRAKEKLIMTGYVKKMQSQLKRWSQKGNNGKQSLGYFQLSQAGNYLDWVVPALKKETKLPFKLQKVYLEDFVEKEVIHQVSLEMKKEVLLGWEENVVYDQQLREALEEQLQFEYPYLAEQDLKSKMTVSELKRLANLSEDQAGEVLFPEENTKEERLKLEKVEIPLPKFLQKEETIPASQKGTLYHRVLQYIDIKKIGTLQDMKREIGQLVDRGKLQEEEIPLLNDFKLFCFFNSDIAKRMKMAKKVYREQPFVLGIPAFEVDKAYKSDAHILVQGIIDAYFEEEGGWVLVDYKTDRVPKVHGEEILRQRYQAQLAYYEKALTQLTGKKVKEKVIYSFYLEKVIEV